MKRSPGKLLFLLAVPALLAAFSPRPATAQIFFPLAASTDADSKVDLGFFSGGTILRLQMSGTVSLLNGSDFFTRSDGSLVIPVLSSVYQYANPGATGYPTDFGGDGINHFPGGGMNYDVITGLFGFAGAETTDTTSPDVIRHGAVVATFSSMPSRGDWFPVGLDRTIPIPASGANLYVAVNDSDSANNVGFYLGELSMLTSIQELRVPGKIIGSRTVSGKVILSAPAPPGGAVIALSTTNPALTIPPSLTIPAGKTSRTFKIKAAAVTEIVTGEITGSYNGGNVTVPVLVRPIGVGNVALSPNPVDGGNTVLGIVTLEAPAAPGDITVTLTSSNTSVATVTPNVTIPAGSTSAFFTVNTTSVASSTFANITATANNVGKTRRLFINP